MSVTAHPTPQSGVPRTARLWPPLTVFPWAQLLFIVVLAAVLSFALGPLTFTLGHNTYRILWYGSGLVLSAAAIGVAAVSVPRLREYDLARPAARWGNLVVVLLGQAAVFVLAIGVVVHSHRLRKGFVAANIYEKGWVHLEQLVSNTVFTMGCALILIPLLGRVWGSAAAALVIAGCVGLCYVVPSGRGMPYTYHAGTDPWFDPWSVAWALGALAVGALVWWRTGGAWSRLANLSTPW
ncbi:hypothetical protein C1Y63_05310 [Corynebacterium sp. 13CS0277]|uniref:hypothetical protein n=1 Tax=Corynebacterium sp. 13CS0277 TaxID=2071994 RepID=UPI000D03B0DF|nr:hypothetical protein [Corynebacterium sp. 13CS0277]PRQ11600.1 hypothetical protein C1Y63_05310 [Corynebacterium sp. 13CS0277]